jgi:hypothetical protein
MSKLGFKSPSKGQITALQALYSKWQAHSIEDAGDPRAERLQWASENVGHTIASFKELTSDEARRLIDVLKLSMGQKLTRQPRPWKRIRDDRRAHEAGTAGRKGVRSSIIQLASPDDLARIDEAVKRLGWTEDRLKLWLQSPSSPVRNIGDSIRTIAEANKVWWALKAMLVRNGLWDTEKGKRSARRAPMPTDLDKETSVGEQRVSG